MSENDVPSKSSKRKWYAQCFREKWLEDPELKDWLRQEIADKNVCFCAYCNSQLKNANKSMLMKHRNTTKHKNKSLETSRDYFCSKLEVAIGDESFDSPQEIDQSFTNILVEPLSQDCPSPPKKLKIKSSDIKRKSFDEAIGTFYKTLNSSSEDFKSNFDDSDEAFGLYLGKELKNIKNISVKKKIKLKLMNIILNTDNSADVNNSQRSFPILVSTPRNISFPNVINKIPSSNEES